MVMQNNIAPAEGSKRKRKRVGRGDGSGHGTYSCRGSKGQKSRSGGGVRPYFEGGQLPLVQRLSTKRGFVNIFKIAYSVVNVGSLNALEAGEVVDRAKLIQLGLVKSASKPVKILGGGEIDRSLIIKADKFSSVAKNKIEAAGGTVQEAGIAAKAR